MRRPTLCRLPGSGRPPHLGGLALAMAMLLWAACDFGLVEPGAEMSPARLWLDFQFLEPAGSVAGQVALNPGDDFFGPRTVADERLWMDGGVIDARPIVGEALIYDVSAELRASAGAVRIVPPGVVGLPVSPDTVRVTLLWILAPDTLFLPRDDQVEIGVVGCCNGALSAGPDFSDSQHEGSWAVVIEPDSAGRAEGIEPVTLGAEGPPRSPITLSGSVLDPRLEGGSVEVTVSTHLGLRSSDNLYEIDLWQDAITTVPFRIVTAGGSRGGRPLSSTPAWNSSIRCSGADVGDGRPLLLPERRAGLDAECPAGRKESGA